MSRRDQGLKAVLDELTLGADRSPLFRWLVDHHDELVAASAGKRIQWGPLCKKFEALGLTDRTGKPATESAARKTWLRARVMVAQARAALAAAPPKRLMPSRLPKDWRPEVVSTRQWSVTSSPGQMPAFPAPAPSQRPRTLPPPPAPVYDTPPPSPVFVSNRTYERKWIPDEELDLSLVPETTTNEKGETIPMPLEARRVLARAMMDLRNDAKETFGFGGG